MPIHFESLNHTFGLPDIIYAYQEGQPAKFFSNLGDQPLEFLARSILWTENSRVYKIVQFIRSVMC